MLKIHKREIGTEIREVNGDRHRQAACGLWVGLGRAEFYWNGVTCKRCLKVKAAWLAHSKRKDD